ncbi:uncharacterized protein BJ212DRAFT_1325570 [Suillus subaureus]|uniref:Hydrophobin n=1 Tax=Suillus subaureus TaxID=48587 RepID=A0A9P7EJE4_9AGAM|nr:uncharacterized protein BJ212DRAFT_1325570 [Suillus subaureus]KAG1823622.1 hypothetical protein BJ212DRAFT_1325570 [Suillus subaureus]
MRFSLLAVIAALTAFMSVSATPGVFSRACTADGESCGESSECCSFALCNRIVVGCAILRTGKILKSWHVARVSHFSTFVFNGVIHGSIPNMILTRKRSI